MTPLPDRLRARARSTSHRVDRWAAGLGRLGRAPLPTTPRPATLDIAYANEWRDSRCVFSLSTGRTGTQTLAALLDLSPAIDVAHEPHPRLVKASFDYYMDPTRDAAEWRRVVLAARDDLLMNSARRGQIYAETNNRMTYLAEVLGATFPCSKFIFLHRNPIEVIRSGQRRGWYRDHPWDFARIRPRHSDDAADRWAGMGTLERIAWYWAEVNRSAADFVDSLGPDRAITVRADDLFDASTGTAAQVFRFVGVPEPPARRLAAVLRTPRNVQVGGHLVSLPDAWSADERASVQRQVSATAERLGYAV